MYDFKKLQRLGSEKKKSAAINKVELADKDPLQEIKDSLYFSSYDLPISSNPFIKTAKILGKSIPLLIDTGADLSLVSKHILPQETEIKRINQKARAANGSDIPILGFIQNLKINIDQNPIYVQKILVTSCDLKYLLLGAPDILKYPHIIKPIFQKKSAR